MSALARYFHSRGVDVSGYDKTRSPLTAALESEGIPVYFEDNAAVADPAADWVIYTPAIPADSVLLGYYRKGGYPLLKRSDVLQQITADSYNICVAGTHGKTTITTLIAHILRHSGYGGSAFLGGISVNYDTNYWSSDLSGRGLPGSGRPPAATERNVCVVEADEYDRSFLKLSPDIAVITAMDPDHLDIYGTVGAMEEAFIAFAGRVKPGGWLLGKYGLTRTRDLAMALADDSGRYRTYHLTDAQADVHAIRLQALDGTYFFDVRLPDAILEDFTLHIGGLYNVENALAAIAVAYSLGIQAGAIRSAVSDFQGVRRRFEYIIRTPDLVLVDDYAHHPEELRALICGARDLFPGRTCLVVFQPHLYTRTRDLAAEFAASLDLADEVILMPIYPARELPIQGVTSELILNRMKNPRKRIMTREELLDWASTPQRGPLLVLMAGAGDIDSLVRPLAEKLKKSA
jgi:UDP-N-acetylmuramate--alanine ligase